MPVEYSSTIESKSRDHSVTIETHDEHHMAANSVFIIPSRPIGNVLRFQTTNGNRPVWPANLSADRHTRPGRNSPSPQQEIGE